ncbi:hypothetical protein U0070_016417 [Myodes glareolus]|uniref:Uncharacterized protein n=1 Tax=Myodes glareolus TaxID=447135 RepID=A0AAW0JYG8_MYOGA
MLSEVTVEMETVSHTRVLQLYRIQLELQMELGRRSEQSRLLGLILIVCLIICHHLKAISSAPASRVHPEAEALRRNQSPCSVPSQLRVPLPTMHSM